MRRRNAEAPIIIKRGKKCRCEAHGGNWKVALADFMTSMFIFCLAMWLINITTTEQKVAVSDYFSVRAISAETSGSNGILGGQTIVSDGAMMGISGQPAVITMPPSQLAAMDLPDLIAEGEASGLSDTEMEYLLNSRDEMLFLNLEKELRDRVNDIPELAEIAGNITVEKVDMGLKITLKDLEGQPMFNSGSAEPLGRTREVLELMAPILADMQNKIKIAGHTDAVPYSGGQGGYSNWELSADRANAARRTMVNVGLPADQIVEVQGKADIEPLNVEDPRAPENRRLEILVMGADETLKERLAADNLTGDAPRDLRTRPADALDANPGDSMLTPDNRPAENAPTPLAQ